MFERIRWQNADDKFPDSCHHLRKGIIMSLSRNRDVARAEHVQNGEGHMYRDLLLTEDYQSKLAHAIYLGILSYLEEESLL